MRQIKFAHRYLKFPRDYQQSMLLDVLPVRLQDLSPQFLAYDTSYEENGEIKHYPLPKSGNYMILLLQAGSGHGQIWTTIRSQWGKSGDKLKYYQGLIGQEMECKVILWNRKH